MMGFLWFWLVAVMIVGYVVLDGFDLGVGVLHMFLVRTEAERKAALASIGPVWDGNEVWLLAGGGTLYFAFPLLYASAFSGFYLPLMIVLWLLILRGVSVELRNHIDVGVWRSLLDGVFGFSSALLTIFFGAALANVLRGVPLNPDGYFFLPLWTNWQPGVSPGILDWYTVIGGLVAFTALTLHGALWLSLKTSGDLEQRARNVVSPLWLILVALTVVSLFATIAVRPASLDNYFNYPFTFVIPAGVIASLAALWFWNRKAPAVESLSRLVPLSLLHAGRSLLGRLSGAAARHHRISQRHHPRPRHLRPAHSGRRPRVVDRRHGDGNWLRGLRLLALQRQSGRGRGRALSAEPRCGAYARNGLFRLGKDGPRCGLGGAIIPAPIAGSLFKVTKHEINSCCSILHQLNADARANSEAAHH